MEIFASILYYPIGWFYLWIRYHNKEKVKLILLEKYDGNYYNAGSQLIWGAFGIVLIGLLSIFLLVVIGRIIFDAIT